MKSLFLPPIIVLLVFDFGGYAQTNGMNTPFKAPRVIITSDFPPLDVIPAKGCTGPANKCSDPDHWALFILQVDIILKNQVSRKVIHLRSYIL